MLLNLDQTLYSLVTYLLYTYTLLTFSKTVALWLNIPSLVHLPIPPFSRAPFSTISKPPLVFGPALINTDTLLQPVPYSVHA
jgi:hypothetical protein